MRDKILNKERLLGQTIGLSLLMLVSKVLAFGREMIISYVYGASAISDAYNIANSIVVLVFATIAEGVVNAYIPRCTKISDNEERNRFTNNLINITMFIMAIVIIVGFLFTEPITDIVGAGFSAETKLYASQILRFAFVAAACYFIIAIMNGYLNIHKSVGFNGIQLIIINLCMIVCILLTKGNPQQLGIGYMISYLIPTVVVFFLARKYTYHFRFQINVHDERVAEVYRVALFAIIGTNVIKLNAMIDKMFASNYPEGSVTALNNGYTIALLVPEIFVMALVTVIFPRISQAKADGDENSFYVLLIRGIKTILLLMLPMTILIYTLANPIIAILFERGAFTAEDTLLTAKILRGYAVGMIGISLNFLLCRAFMAWKREKLSAVVLGAVMLCNMILNAICTQNFACEGLSISTSVIVTIIAVIFIIIFCKAAHGREYVQYKENSIFFGKLAIASMIMAFTTKYVNVMVWQNLVMEGLVGSIVKTMLVAVCGMIVYMAVLCMLRVNVLDVLGVSCKSTRSVKG